MVNRGKRATKNHIKHAFIVVFVRFFQVCGEVTSPAQSKKPRVVRGSGHARVAMSKLIQVILAAQKRLFN